MIYGVADVKRFFWRADVTIRVAVSVDFGPELGYLLRARWLREYQERHGLTIAQAIRETWIIESCASGAPAELPAMHAVIDNHVVLAPPGYRPRCARRRSDHPVPTDSRISTDPPGAQPFTTGERQNEPAKGLRA
jgi:hypothetical protein